MVRVATGSAEKHSLRNSTLGVDVFARTACLRAVRGGNLDERAAAPCQLVTKHVREHRPTSVKNSSRETSVYLDHVIYLKLLNHDGAVAIGVAVTENMQEVFALSSHFTMNARNVELSLLSVLRSFLAPGDGALSVSKASKCSAQPSWGFNDSTIGVGNHVDHTTVDGDNGFYARQRIGDLNFAHDRCKPLISVTFDRASFRRALQWTMDDGVNRPDLRKMQCGDVEPPRFCVGFTKTYNVTVLELPSWCAVELLETPLPRLVQLDEKLCRNVSRYVSKPRQCSAQLRQFVDLIETCRVDTIPTRSCVSNQALFVGKVPEKSESVAPSIKTSGLICRWVDAEFERLVNDHKGNSLPRRREIVRRGFLPVLNGAFSASEMR